MIYRYTLIAFVATISLILASAGLSGSSTEIEAYNPLPTFSGGPGTGGLGDRTGSPISSGTCTACHGGGSFSSSVTVEVFDGPTTVTSYTAGQTYTVVYTVSGTPSGFGFQGGALTSTNAAGGTFSLPSTNTQLVTIAGRPYIEHNSGLSASGVFQANWTAPAVNTGTIIFYGIGLAANGNGGTSGDQVTTPISLSLTEDVPTSVSYPGNPFCGNGPDQFPLIMGEQTGSFSSGAGLSINSSSGAIDVSASTPGTYFVAYVHSMGVASTEVTIFPTYTSSSTAAICDNETIQFGSQVLDASDVGLNTEVFQSVNGCDSTVELTLSVLPTYIESDAVTICPSETYDFNGQTLTASDAGLNTAVLQSVDGCDSTINLTLTVEAVDVTVSLSAGVLTANQAGAAYQWIDCDNGNMAITGETNNTYSPGGGSGNYSVEITLNGCTETSACTFVDFSSIDELNFNSSVVFPNPVLDLFEIKNIEQFGTITSISLLDASGKVVEQIAVNQNTTNIGHLDAGVYFLRIVSESGDSMITLVKK